MQELNLENSLISIEGYQLSPQQRYICKLQQSDPYQPYHVQLSVKIIGDLNRDIFKSAATQVVNRHEILRTSFQNLPGLTAPLQVINSENILFYKEFNLSNLDSSAHNFKRVDIFQELEKITFDLESDSYLYIYLLILSPSQHIMLMKLSALCGDVISAKNLISEINLTYSNYLHSQEITEEPLQYVDIATWQNELLTTADGEKSQTYWQQKDIYENIHIQLPGEKQSYEITSYNQQFITVNLNSHLQENINIFLQKNPTSLDNFLLACWQILLWKITGHRQLIVSTCFDGRKYQELECAVGLLAKYLPCEVALEINQTFNDVLKQIAENSQQAYQWQEYYDWENNNQGHLLGYDFQDINLPINNWYIEEINTCLDKFKLRLSCLYNQGNLQLDFYYHGDLFTAKNIKNLAAQFEQLITSAVTHPEANISHLDILTECDRLQLLYEFNDTHTDFPQDQLIHQLFATQAQSTPNNIALVYNNQRLTYAELNTRANQLAHYLQKLGVKPETIVAICLERSIDAIIAILAILKAGAAYLPLDPSFPTGNIQERLADAQAQILLTNNIIICQQHSTLSAPIVVCLDTVGDNIISQSSENPHSNVTTENLAYVIYTSGSTGKAKGVAIEHRQILNYLHSIQQKLELPNYSSFALVSTLASDLGNTAIFPSLCSGGCLHLISIEQATNGQALANYCREHPIDCLKIVPSHLEALLTSSSAQDLLPKTRLILGGEACTWELIKNIQNLAPNCQIFNHYGPTETTVGVLTYQVKQIDSKSATVPLGKALANIQVYVLDSQLQLVPCGVPGELYIGGACLARGYLNSPELTAEKFINHPFSQQPSAKLYKTGDIVKYLSDGNIEYLGRTDQQVKIRGFRIELGEIEAVLTQHPGVQKAVVVLRADGVSNQCLVGYVVPDSQAQLKSSDLRDFVAQMRPEYMVPSAVVILKVLPLTANGKVDRQALPAPQQLRPELEATFVPPETVVEKALAEIWAEVLGLEQVGIHDNFFDLGGHSLLLTQVTSRLYSALGVELSLRQLFATPTIAELATLVAQEKIEQTDEKLLEQMLAELEDA
jgi:amino acid adenylation domain-containing protein